MPPSPSSSTATTTSIASSTGTSEHPRGIERAALNFGQMTQDQRDALPKMLLTWQQIGADVSGTAGNLNRLTKPHWYDRLLGYGLNAAVIYRNLNP